VLATSDYVRRGPVKSVLVNIHEFLMLPEHIGFAMVGWMGVALTFIGLSGLVLWWPQDGSWRSAFLVRRGTARLRLHIDLHRVVGIWGWLVLLALSISGMYLTFPLTVTHAVETLFPGETLGADPPATVARKTGPLGPDHAAEYAVALVPDARV